LWMGNFLKSVSLLLKYCHCESFLTPDLRTVREIISFTFCSLDPWSRQAVQNDERSM
jgi:hypothetical protein